jgi:hypothetical protein
MAPAAALREAVVVLVVIVLESLAKHYDYNFSILSIHSQAHSLTSPKKRVKK